MRKPSRKSLVRSLDTIFSLFIRARDKACFTCGTRENLTCGHLFTRAAYSTRWHEEFSKAQCGSCNLTHEYKPEIFTERFIDTYGLDKYKEGIRIHHTTTKFSDLQLKGLIETFKQKLAEIKNGRI